ncbi:MAG: iron-sulfur cluster repair di-iron protein [Acetobacteraceae bacterium]
MSTTQAAAAPFGARTLAEIAVDLPGATGVFRRHKLDFCCGGRVKLAEAAAEKGIPLADLAAELDAAAERGQGAGRPPATPDLVDWIETRFHATHRRDLPELLRLARRVEAVHRAHPAVPHGLALHLETMAAALEDHMRKEEAVLFPLMRRGGHPGIVAPIRAMLIEHEDHGVHLRELERLTGNFAVPEGACPTWRALYAGIDAFTADLLEHIHTENNVLFPRFTG